MRTGWHERTLAVAVVCGLIMSVAGQADGQWQVNRKAFVRSSDGHRLMFSRTGDGPIQVSLELSGRVEGAFGERLPVYRVDDNEVSDLGRAPIQQVKEGHWMRWIVHDGAGEPGKQLIEFMSGDVAVFQYYLPDGSIREITFLLTGAGGAIAELLRSGAYG